MWHVSSLPVAVDNAAAESRKTRGNGTDTSLLVHRGINIQNTLKYIHKASVISVIIIEVENN